MPVKTTSLIPPSHQGACSPWEPCTWLTGHEQRFNENGRLEMRPVLSVPEVRESDPVKHPAHYTFGKYEVLDVIEDWKLCFNLGSAVKYIARAGKKDPTKTIEDLRKAIFQIERKIKALEGK